MGAGQRADERVPAVVVGAGYAGLAAALRLSDSGVPVVVLEAADRVGGRIHTERTADGVLVDLGGQWVGPTQRNLLAWAERFGCATFPTWDTGDYIEKWVDGTLRRYRGGGPADGPGMRAYLDAADRLDELAATVRTDAPFAADDAAEWDAQTVHSYFARTVPSADARRRLDLAVQGVWSTEPRDISLLHLLFYMAAAGGFDQLMETEGAAQERRFTDGAQAPARAAAAHLGEAVRLGTEVRRIDHDDDGVLVRTTTGTVAAERVVMATPPPATAAIRFAPALPVARARWIQRSPMGDVAKVHAIYPRPFWRDEGLAGVATVYGDDAVGVVFDNSPPDASAGVLVAFVYGDRLRRWSALAPADRRAEAVGTLRALFGPAAGSPAEYVEKIWPDDPWARGGYVANPAPGTWVEHGAGWRAPCGRIHWAGTETADVWNGYMDGAISSGDRAATEVLAALR